MKAMRKRGVNAEEATNNLVGGAFARVNLQIALIKWP